MGYDAGSGRGLPCFLAPQIAQKALKAFLHAQGEPVVTGHSRLCRRASGYDSEFAERAKTWVILDGYYVPTRYPNSLPDSIPARVYTRAAAAEAVRLAAEAVEFVAMKIKPSPAEPSRETES